MSVLVNGSPTKEFVVERGPCQGDPLSPFLFVIVAEGLKIMVNKAVVNGGFVGCYVNNKYFVDVLQFVDDTLLVGDGSWKYLWATKAVLRGFEMVSGLGINFNKSKLIGIDINSRFMDVATSFLACKMEEKDFTFLCICIGSNPKRMHFWNPLVEKIRKRLSSWKGRRWLFDFLLAFFMDEGGIIKLLFPCLFAISYLQEVYVACVGVWDEGEWKWNGLGISHVPADLKLQEEELRALLQHHCPLAANTDNNDHLDWVVWLRPGQDSFSVSSCYSVIGTSSMMYDPPSNFDFVYPLIWKVEVPLKIKAFGWRCFKYRIPTKDLLLHRGILSSTSNLGCVFCEDSIESPIHLLLSCRMADEVWKEMACWIGLTNYKEGDFKESYWR
ncbi:uncharacterized protein LOC131658199 [Vicia villosa]|uniref:uncharacterized protein LOC131658199 n=1 Tax=Vicia villosa TaxID=3911 RepID=UPI00273B6D41|nr:uncharacterized protein LOC131658199 [Vicia villosa]